MKLDPTALYLGDNGRCFCGKHAGETAAVTGRDLSGQPVHRLTAVELATFEDELGAPLQCEQCRRPS